MSVTIVFSKVALGRGGREGEDEDNMHGGYWSSGDALGDFEINSPSGGSSVTACHLPRYL
jgi:hypothetical protein